MDSERPHLSITLPRNFMFHYRDGPAPQTPEPEPQPEQYQPPPPPRQTLRVRRRRTTLTRGQDILENSMEQMPIPTIEMSDVLSEASTALPVFPLAQNNAYLSPGMSFPRLLSPPKTPVAQMRTISHLDGPRDWADIKQASQIETTSRPTSSSGFSESSISSRGSLSSIISRGGSCTSPEEEVDDPFSYCSPVSKYSQPTSPSAAHQHSRPNKKLRLKSTFNEDMDRHLWMTYMKYLQDPIVTPFKALPSTMPPNGVCHRVARMARRTWQGPRPSRAVAGRTVTQYGTRCGTPSALRALRSGSNTPIARPSKSYLRFPTEKQCRKRLRDLAKQKPTLSAHYQRMLHRSPSPFQSSPPAEPSQPQPQPQARTLSSPFATEAQVFSTRDMNVSLATSTAESMQLGNPLSQLASDITPRPAERKYRSMRASAHQKSQSLHIGLGLGLGNVLGSPFQAKSAADMHMHRHNAQTWHAPSSTQPPRLGSPFQLHSPRPKARAFKRRALHSSFEDKSRNRGNSFVDELFGAPAESSHRRVRSRGFSLGDMMDGARRLPLSTHEINPFVNIAAALPSPAQTSPVGPTEARGQATSCLGSPFGGRSSRTFPRASASYSFEPPASFEQRFAGTPSTPARLSRS
ncbi:hypothetical protein P153DRAFT_372179 [Dothidotthia symphoricarpi CBS 119687]|uniref:Uncharacterized protein n=1 Tax=Dothidotthia symphoricarpi CBS 119687 TaxID=1392245 RepID=A0A6A6AVQ1_9PLEO|nr:uncharacterized protein P153DRAFT_372179 [Dothidotthia symphoricarpi CBS 119687]KAF2134917.1 hypothetical protein P153DRAFT_372179 [Dothidotthia symphoricarpi CBS 119687]